MPEVECVRTIGHKSAVLNIPPTQVHRRQLIASGEPHDRRRVSEDERIAQNEDPLGTLLARCVEGCLKVSRVARLDDDQLHSQQRPEFGEPRLISPVRLVSGIDQHGDP